MSNSSITYANTCLIDNGARASSPNTARKPLMEKDSNLKICIHAVADCSSFGGAHGNLCAVNQTADKPYFLFDGYAHLAAGLACGLAGLAAGMAIGIVGDAGVRQLSLCLATPVHLHLSVRSMFRAAIMQWKPCCLTLLRCHARQSCTFICIST